MLTLSKAWQFIFPNLNPPSVADRYYSSAPSWSQWESLTWGLCGDYKVPKTLQMKGILVQNTNKHYNYKWSQHKGVCWHQKLGICSLNTKLSSTFSLGSILGRLVKRHWLEVVLIEFFFKIMKEIMQWPKASKQIRMVIWSLIDPRKWN